MKTKLIDYHRRLAEGAAASARRNRDQRWHELAVADRRTADFHERAARWLEGLVLPDRPDEPYSHSRPLPQTGSPADAAVSALEKASA